MDDEARPTSPGGNHVTPAPVARRRHGDGGGVVVHRRQRRHADHRLRPAGRDDVGHHQRAVPAGDGLPAAAGPDRQRERSTPGSARSTSQTDGPAPAITWMLAANGLNIMQPPEFIVGLPVPLPNTDVVLLATASILVPEPGQEIAFHLLPSPYPSLIQPPGYPVQQPDWAPPPGQGFVVATPASGCTAHARGGDQRRRRGDRSSTSPSPATATSARSRSAAQVTRTLQLHNAGSTTVCGLLTLTGEAYAYRHDAGSWTAGPTWCRLAPGATLDGRGPLLADRRRPPLRRPGGGMLRDRRGARAHRRRRRGAGGDVDAAPAGVRRRRRSAAVWNWVARCTMAGPDPELHAVTAAGRGFRVARRSVAFHPRGRREP